MNPDSIGAATGGTGATGSPTDLSSAQAQQSAAEFDQLIAGIGSVLLSVVLEDMIQISTEE